MRMGKIVFSFSVLAVLAATGCAARGPYRDGVYEGKSRASYTSEPFWGTAAVTIRRGRIDSVDFKIMDTALNEEFGAAYESHYAGNQLYINQCRNEVKALAAYPGQLLKSQGVEGVDAVSGATWSYDLFTASVKAALEKAK